VRKSPTAATGQWLQLTATILFAAALAVLSILGVRRADELQSASSALQLASQLSAQPQLIGAELTLIQRGLETTTYVGDSVRTLDGLRAGTATAFAAIQHNLRDAGLQADPAVNANLAAALSRWHGVDRGLDALRGRQGGELYSDTAAGSQLSAAGKSMKATVDGMLTTQTQNLQLMGAGLARLGVTLRTAVDASGRSLRTLLLGGAAVATVLLGLMLYYAWRSRQAARAAASAERQVSNILGTVREGLFLIDRDLRLGATCSDSLRELLRLPSPAGRHLEEVLQPLVDAKTLGASLKFLGLLWRDKVNEELIESVNPLSQIEVSFGNAHGGTDVRYLAFSFRRVRAAEAAGDYILGVVADVTDRVLLARELEHVKADSDSQASLQLQLLRVDPALLRTFLAAADVAFRKSNAVLTTSGIEQEDFKKKLNGVFRELHTVKGEAAALALSSFVQRIHAIEDALGALRGRSALTGNDFLPVVVKLDELISHLAQVRSMQERVATLRSLNRSQTREEDSDTDGHRDTTVITDPAVLQGAAGGPGAASAPGSALVEMFRNLAHEVAKAHARSVRLKTQGLELVPPPYAALVKDICIQMIRNSIAHGIEPPEARIQHGKHEAGTVQINFAADASEDYVLTVEDDGHGLSYEQIVDKALRLDLISPQQAVTLERTAIYRLIFQAGFSTAEEVSEHAGRGVGLDAVSTLVREHGGRIGVSTAAGRYTRFKVLLPKAAAAGLAASSAA
jgi:HPt (histidine-containing phosphotransfer) domain-containing protein